MTDYSATMIWRALPYVEERLKAGLWNAQVLLAELQALAIIEGSRRMKSPHELRYESQDLLVQFLRSELTIAATFVRSAVNAGDSGHTKHFAYAREGAEKAIETIRRSVGRVQDVQIRAEIVAQLAELERTISTL